MRPAATRAIAKEKKEPDTTVLSAAFFFAGVCVGIGESLVALRVACCLVPEEKAVGPAVVLFWKRMWGDPEMVE